VLVALKSLACPTSPPYSTHLIMPLHLIISLSALLIRRRRLLTPTRLHPLLTDIILRRRHRPRLLTGKLLRGRRSNSAVPATRLASCPSLRCPARFLLNVIVRHATLLRVLLLQLGVGRVRVRVDDVPGVQEAGEHAETAQCEVDERVGAAETALDPDCDGVSGEWIGDVLMWY